MKKLIANSGMETAAGFEPGPQGGRAGSLLSAAAPAANWVKMNDMEAQKSPFPGITPHLHPPRVRIKTWFIEPAGMFNKADPGTQINAAVATHISEHVYNLMRARFPLASRYLFIHDFSESAGYDTQGRQILTQWALRVRSQIANVIVITPPTNSLFSMGLDTVSMMLRMSGIPFEIATSLEQVRARYPMKPCSDAP